MTAVRSQQVHQCVMSSHCVWCACTFVYVGAHIVCTHRVESRNPAPTDHLTTDHQTHQGGESCACDEALDLLRHLHIVL